MDEFPLSPIPLATSVKDAADFCRPLAVISNVDMTLDFGKTENAVILANGLRLQQVGTHGSFLRSINGRSCPLTRTVFTLQFVCLMNIGAHQFDIQRHQIHTRRQKSQFDLQCCHFWGSTYSDRQRLGVGSQY